MLLITGGSAYNASKFINDCNHIALVPRYKKDLNIKNKNVKFYDNLSDLYKSEYFSNIEYVINFSSSYNYSRNYRTLITSSIVYVLKVLLRINKKKLKLFINIGTYSQDAKSLHKSKTKYVRVKNFSDVFFSAFVSKKKYLNLKLGDTYGPNDPRQKLNSILNNHVSNETLEVYGSKKNVLYPVSIYEIRDCINFVINNSYLFENKYVCSANAFGRGVTLNDYIERIKKKQNLYYEVNFKNEDIHIEILDEAKSDFNFLINNI